MPKDSRFRPLLVDDFADLLNQVTFVRHIESVHMHHTWRPTHTDFHRRGGLALVESMWRYHTNDLGWDDIAQHVTIDPNGVIWTGRDWNAPPASARGFNGNRAAGPFMFEMIGNFDEGFDALEGKQLDAVVEVIARVQARFSLPVESLRFHNSMTDVKTCPGTGVDYGAIASRVRDRRDDLVTPVRSRPEPTGWARSEYVDDGIRGAPSKDIGDGELRAEPPEETMSAAETVRVVGGALGGTRGGLVGGDDLSPEILDRLRPHVVNLREGGFSDDGQFRTTPADVEAIFADHLPRALAATPDTSVLRIAFWAHGGLVDESSGLRIAFEQVDWMKRNRVYPIHFVWETGFFDALWQILRGVRAMRAPRDLADYTTDPVIQELVRKLGGVKIWGAMKRSAELASSDDGGATLVAERLAQFAGAHPGRVEVHAVGHSAGSIFHAHFLPRALAAGVPTIKTLQLLAPAVRMDVFVKRLKPFVVGSGIDDLTMYTMRRDYEEADSVVGAYRKSLLYLIYHALEEERRCPILGLEESVRANADVRDLFGVGGPPGMADLVLSVTDETSGRDASGSVTHGGFDNDPPTMNSVLRRILSVADGDKIVGFPESSSRSIAVARARPPAEPAPAGGMASVGAAEAPSQVPALPLGGGGRVGRRKAVCIGIDDYENAPLAGCVADARLWARTLRSQGFDVEATLLNAEATRRTILQALRDLIAGSAAGDVLAFQFAGHGTYLPDLDGDERDGTDEALCPFDMESGEFVVDDDIGATCDGLPDGVNLTLFVDCCHSGTVSRLAGPSRGRVVGADRRARFTKASARAVDLFLQSRQESRARNSRPGERFMREVLYSACSPTEVAYETNGQGAFTVRACAELARASGLTNREYQERVTAAFGPSPAQNPELSCEPVAASRKFLEPW